MAKNQRSALLNRNFLLLVQGGWISQVGTQVAMVATSYWIKRSTDSASLVGLLATTAALPVLFLSPVAGAVADRWSKRNTLIFWDILGGIVSWGFFFLIGLHVFSLHQILVGIFLGNLVLSTAATFATPACNAFVAELVQTGQLGKAMAFTQASGLIAIIVGQAAAGVLLSRFEAHALFGVDAISYFISAASLLCIRLIASERKKIQPNVLRTVGNDIRDGLLYIWHNRGLRNLLLASLPIHLFTSPVLVFLPFYTTNTLHEPLSRYGYLLSMVSVGILTGLAGGSKLNPQGRHVHAILFGSLAANALLIFILSSIHWFWGAMAVLFVSGIAAGLTMLLALNAVMLNTDPEKRGRASSIMMLVGQGVTPLAMSVVGYFGDRLGGNVQLLYTLFSVLLFATSICLYFNHDLRRLFTAEQHASA